METQKEKTRTNLLSYIGLSLMGLGILLIALLETGTPGITSIAAGGLLFLIGLKK